MSAAGNIATGPGHDSGPGTRASRAASARTAPDPDQVPGLVSGSPRQKAAYRRMMAVCDQVAAAAVQDADAAELVRVFAVTAGKTVVLLGPDFRPRAHADSNGSAGTGQPWDPAEASIARVLRVLAAERKPLRVPPLPGSVLPCGCLATPVMVSDTVLAYL